LLLGERAPVEGELDDLRAFVGVVEAGGFSRAAARLGLAKSIVSRRVARLEASLGGARLLARTTRGVSPTESGAAFHARCVRVLAELDEAREEVAGREAELVGTLRLAAPLSFGIAHLAPALARFAAEHPRLALDVAYSDRMVDLVAERLDAAVRIGALVDSSLVARRLAPVRLVAVASPAYLDRRGVPETPADLARHDCLVYSAGAEGSGGGVWRFRTGGRGVATTLRPHGRFRADNGEALVAAALEGLGIAVLPTFLAGGALRSGALVPLLRAFPMPEQGLHVVRPPGGPPPARLRALTDFLLARFGPEPYWDPCWNAPEREEPPGGGGRR
jgi:DNA-binding transcriptional LysR family regulator